MTVLILHGIYGHAGIHWQQWLCDELQKKEYRVIMPTLPNANHPNRSEWLQAVVDNTDMVNLSDLIIVGHSLGVATALDFLEKIDGKVKGLISVAGFAEDYGADLNSYFMRERTVDMVKVKEQIQKSIVIYSDNDPYVSQLALKSLATKLEVKPIIIHAAGHFNTDSHYTRFPLVLESITKLAIH